MDNTSLVTLPLEDSSESEADEEPPSVEEQLDKFRAEWKNEIQTQQSPKTEKRVQKKKEAIESKAKDLFMQGVYAEQNGNLYQAVSYYRQAVQLVPDIEFKIEEFKRKPKEVDRSDSVSSFESSDECNVDDLTMHFSKLQSMEKAVCLFEYEQKATHISALPAEVFILILKWVISNELDIRSLEQFSMVCRGFYLLARDPELWRMSCLHVWDVGCNRLPRNYVTWRDMFLQRPRVNYNGVYISKSSYVRAGEKSLDQFYQPWHIVIYYRYIRFSPDGTMVMLTSPDDPKMIVSKLKHESSNIQGLQYGYYRLTGTQVAGILKRKKTQDYLSTYNKYHRHRRQYEYDSGEQTFQVEFALTAQETGKSSQLTWKRYAVHTKYKNGTENTSEFDLCSNSYPALYFSRVKSYTATSERPLQYPRNVPL